MSLSAGTKLGPYEIQAPLGAGGMGEVYRARDTRLERTVAVKVLPDHLSCDPESRQRFEREARTISSLNHPHICALYDIGTQDGIDFLEMEYLEGQTLADRPQRGALPVEEVLEIGIEIADAFDKAHRQGIVNRDLKPSNIMLTKSGANLMDFCLAKNPDERWQCFRDIVLELKWIATGGSERERWVTRPHQYRVLAAFAATTVIAIAAVLYLLWMSMQPRSRDTTRFVMQLPAGHSLVVPDLDAPALDLSRDGRYLAYVAQRSGQQAIYLRPIDEFEAKPVPGTENGVAPFFSTDGDWLGFISDGKLKKVPLRGGPPLAICDVQIAAKASWGKNGFIVLR